VQVCIRGLVSATRFLHFAATVAQRTWKTSSFAKGVRWLDKNGSIVSNPALKWKDLSQGAAVAAFDLTIAGKLASQRKWATQ
jgi:hypothetical protein